MRATIFGAGNIGRGLVGTVFADSAYDLTFIDINSDLVTRLNHEKSYTVSTDENRKMVPIERAIDARDETAVVEAVARADVVATAVGGQILGVVAPAVGAGLLRRKRDSVNVVACENIHPNSSALRDHVVHSAGSAAVAGVGFPDVVVDRIVPGDANSLDLIVERAFEFVVDRQGWVGPIPKTSPIVFTDHLGDYKLRKLWMVNCLHVLTAWLGIEAGHQYIHMAIQDKQIRDLVKSASTAGAAVLAAATTEFSSDELVLYAAQSIRRFHNPQLADLTSRVARNPLLKLQPNERVLGPARAAERLGLDINGFAAGVAAALRLRDPGIEGLDELATRLKGGWRRFLIEDCELEPDGRLLNEIAECMGDDTLRTP